MITYIVCDECAWKIGEILDDGSVAIKSHHRHNPDCTKVKRVMDEVTRNSELSRRHFANEP
jgi:hypothetical protein